MATPSRTNSKLSEPTQKQDEKITIIERVSPSPSPEPAVGNEKVVFEDFLHYAALQRLDEDQATSQASHPSTTKDNGWLARLSAHKGTNVNVNVSEKGAGAAQMTPDEQERANASRALRLAGWGSIFYLITTDILGPFNAPYAISQVGWVPGILLYFVMGAMALYTGLILWRLFIRLDSVRYPLKTYADIAERIFGRWAKRVIDVLQGIQLLVNVATICLANGQALSQITRGRLCFSVCIVVWVVVGFVIGQIRTLKNYGWLAHGAVWVNLVIIFTSMGFMANSPPNFAAAAQSLGVPAGPVQTQLFATLPLFKKVNGVMNMVYAYGGALIFPAMMAEMKRPMDFWKGMTLAQLVIFVAYLMYGAFVYAFQGQFTLPLAYQGVSKFVWQTVEAIYIDIIEDWFGGPKLMSRKGRAIWTVMVTAYWALAFIIGSTVPQVQSITGLIAAIATVPSTYSFPPLFRLGYDIITDAMIQDAPYVPGTGATGRTDTWREWSRWKRGLFGGRWYFKLFNFVLFLGGTVMSFLGMWGAGESIKETFQRSGAATSFGCRAPV